MQAIIEDMTFDGFEHHPYGYGEVIYYQPMPPVPPFLVPFSIAVPFPITLQELETMSNVNKPDHVEIRLVRRDNLKPELKVIRDLITTRVYKFASFDTEFPGTVVPPKLPNYHLVSQALDPASYHSSVYDTMKDNVENSHIIQLGLTLSSDLPGWPLICWEFNFSDFDVDRGDHLRHKGSIDFLVTRGMDFSENKRTGINSLEFAEEIWRSGLAELLPSLTWVTFQGGYDFGYMVKMMKGTKTLPEDIRGFMGHVKTYFGEEVYDVKNMIRYCDGVFGGLDRVAEKLQVGRVSGRSHQAGSDSLLTLQTFFKIMEETGDYNKYCWLLTECRGVLYGLTNRIKATRVPY